MRMVERKRGFTLIELLVVIGIIALLAALLVPAVSGALQRSKRSYCLNNVKQVGVGSVAYANDTKGYWPPGSANVKSVGMNHVIGALSDGGQITDMRVWLCPADRNDHGNTPVAATTTTNSDINCGYWFIAGLGDRCTLPPSSTPAMGDEQNQDPSSGDAPNGISTDMTDEDNHGNGYRNVLYFDNHAVTLQSGKKKDIWAGVGMSDPGWSIVYWIDGDK